MTLQRGKSWYWLLRQARSRDAPKSPEKRFETCATFALWLPEGSGGPPGATFSIPSKKTNKRRLQSRVYADFRWRGLCWMKSLDQQRFPLGSCRISVGIVFFIALGVVSKFWTWCRAWSCLRSIQRLSSMLWGPSDCWLLLLVMTERLH